MGQITVSDPVTLPRDLALVRADEGPGEGGFEQLETVDTLVPGYYWRVVKSLKVEDERWKGHFAKLNKGDVHLLLDIFEFEGVAHTAIVLCHPRDGDRDKHKVLIKDFLSHFEPAPDGDQVRSAEQANIMGRIADMQEGMKAAETNPLALPGVQEAAKEAVEKFEQEMVAEASQLQRTDAERQADLRKIHRRAARRSSAAGNPLVVRSTTISDNVGVMIAGGIDSEGLRELTVEARRRTAIATASAKWLTGQAEKLSSTLNSLAPYYAEKGQVALARASKAIKYVKTLTSGLTSLKLYTGDGVDVITVCEGKSASTDEPLTLVQSKRFVDEELAVWADVGDDFDWRQESQFFDKLKTSPSLVDQVFPTERCVISMATTRRQISYSRDMSPFERAIHDIKNKSVFLMVRDGGNIHVVYSSEPSHEAAERLFPSGEEVDGIFRGADGSRIGLQDVAFSSATEHFEKTSLLYLRFLILCCGLDHRMKLFGDFYPPGEALGFMKLEFQQRYFRFLADDESASLLGEDILPVREWMAGCNKAVRSGSRIVVVSTNLTASSPQLKRVGSLKVDWKALPPTSVVQRDGAHHFVSVPVTHSWRDTESTANVWLDGPNASTGAEWFLCLDRIQIKTLRRYIYSRISRAGHISWLRAFKKAEAVLAADLQAQQPLREYLRATALEHRVLEEGAVDEALDAALATWRAARRGAPAPDLGDTKAVQELLTLMYPADRLVSAADALLQNLIVELGVNPLRLGRTGKTRLVLYVEASEADKEPYAAGVAWGWVKRVLVDVKRTKLSVASNSLVWLRKDIPNPQEEEVRVWPQLEAYLNTLPEPCSLKHLAAAKAAVTEAQNFAPLLEEGRSAPRNKPLPVTLFAELLDEAQAAMESIPVEGRGRKKYRLYQTAYVVLPVGVAHTPGTRQHDEAMFLHMRMPVAGFLMRYGSPEQVAVFKRDVVAGYTKMQDKIFEPGQAWRLFSSSVPVLKRVTRSADDWSMPAFMKIDSHKRGGYSRQQRAHSFHSGSTRAERRAQNGSPSHEATTVLLSLDRAIQTLLGRAPHLRREFYQEVSKRRSWPHSREDAAGERAAPRWTPPHVHHFLSPLVWDVERDRPVANKHFSISKD
jgi:hypothetical protein